MKRVHLIVVGHVQGVGYRKWVCALANKVGLTGWVKNREDEAVEITAEGEERVLQEFIRHCHAGPEVAFVERVDETWMPAVGEFSGFMVLY